MYKSLIIFLLLGLAGIGLYFYLEGEVMCPVPIEYSFGTIDDRFGLTPTEAREAMASAEAVWESSTGRELFRHTEDGDDLTVNFFFDERQARAEAEESLRANLDEQQEESESINQTYAELTAQYESVRAEYQAELRDYEARLAEYNATVERYNAEGGAPPGVYGQLQQEAESLDRESDRINRLARRLNDLVAQINELSETGNQIIESYNENVEQYNRSFGEATEFTQGDYTRDTINVYKFISQRELELVLAHELGHALNIGHVEGPQSIMYYLMGGQPAEPVLSSNDLAAFESVCGQNSGLFGFLPINF